MVNKGKGVEKMPMTFEVMNEHNNIKMKIRELSKKLESSDLSEKEIKELRDEINSLTTKVENMENFYDVTKMDLVDVERMTERLHSDEEYKKKAKEHFESFLEEKSEIEIDKGEKKLEKKNEIKTTEQIIKEAKEEEEARKRDKIWNEELDKALEKTDLSGDSFLQELFEKRKTKK